MENENKIEGFITIPDDAKCSYPGCDEKVVTATIYKSKRKGLSVENIHFWCKKHFKQVDEGEELTE